MVPPLLHAFFVWMLKRNRSQFLDSQNGGPGLSNEQHRVNVIFPKIACSGARSLVLLCFCLFLEVWCSDSEPADHESKSGV